MIITYYLSNTFQEEQVRLNQFTTKETNEAKYSLYSGGELLGNLSTESEFQVCIADMP